MKEEIKEKAQYFKYAGIAVYFYDVDTRQTKTLPVLQNNPIYRIRETGESFYLNKPAYYTDGKPVWFILRRYHPSLKVKFLEKHLIEEGYSSEDIDAMVFSSWLGRILRKFGIGGQNIFMLIATNLISILATVVVAMSIAGGI